jgi:hypothetical protein
MWTLTAAGFNGLICSDIVILQVKVARVDALAGAPLLPAGLLPLTP